jgi:hypothetical protein
VVAHYGKLLGLEVLGLEAPSRVRAAQLGLRRGRVQLEVAWDEGAQWFARNAERNVLDAITRRSGSGGT